MSHKQVVTDAAVATQKHESVVPAHVDHAKVQFAEEWLETVPVEFQFARRAILVLAVGIASADDHDGIVIRRDNLVDENAQTADCQASHIDVVAFMAREALETAAVALVHLRENVRDVKVGAKTIEPIDIVYRVGLPLTRHLQQEVGNLIERMLIVNGFRKRVFYQCLIV